jgi:hypothetical protein
MTRRELERWLRAHGARFERHGARHDIWRARDGRTAAIPRYREINLLTARGICEDLGAPWPPGR